MTITYESESQNENYVTQETQETSYQSTGEVPQVNGHASIAAVNSPIETTDAPRPRTRSQSGITTKRRLSEELHLSSSQKTPATRKKPRAASTKPSSPIDMEYKKESIMESPMADSNDVSQSTTRSSSPYNSSSTPSLTFLESSASPGYAPERRGPRSRATLPVPVPNLTKKSRGRRVPTQEPAEAPGEIKEKRMYVCSVDGCAKRFHRGEHLKRHIRSIHTHEKPFECAHPSCGKFFNRHDNLLQHLKVHKQNPSEENGNPRPILKLSPTSPSLSPEPEPSMEEEPESSASDSEVCETPMVITKQAYPVASPAVYNPYAPSTRFGVSSESFLTNMAVSSLRTELPPHSPPASRVRDAL